MNWMKVRKYLPNCNGYTSEKVILCDSSSNNFVICGKLKFYKNGRMKWQTDKGTYPLEKFTHWSYIDKTKLEIK